MGIQKNSRAAKNSKAVVKLEKRKTMTIKQGDKLPVINLIPTANWMITTAFIEAEKNSLFQGGSYRPTFLNMQQILAIGPRTEDVKVGDWVYIDMTRFIKTVKKKSTIRAGIGGEDMVTEQLVPPVFAAPGDPNTYFKINDREIEGVIIDPYSMNKEYDTLENFVFNQEAMQEEVFNAKQLEDAKQAKAFKPKSERKAPMIITETSPNRV